LGAYILRRLLIALPSLLGISVVLFTVLALAPGDPFEELVTNPNVPAEVKEMLRAKFGLDDPIWQRYFRWLTAMLQGDWGFSFNSRVDVDTLILQRVPVTLAVIGASQVLALLVALPVGIVAARALFLVRPHRQHAGLRRLLAAHLLHRPAADPAVLDHAGLAALSSTAPTCLGEGWDWWWGHIKQSIMPVLVLGLFQAASYGCATCARRCWT
jgi:peptide/nickel transport system permease protein